MSKIKYTTLPLEKRQGIAGRHKIVCGMPAEEERDALVTGNGALLVSDRGNPQREVFTVKQEGLFSPQWPEPPKGPLIRDYLPEVRRRILNGENEYAERLADVAAAQRGTPAALQENQPHPAIELCVTQKVSRADGYLHVCDMRTSEITTRWEEEGLFTRKLFCSRADGILALRFEAPEGRLNLTLKGEFPEIIYQKEKMGTNDLPGEGDGYFACIPVPPQVEIVHDRKGIRCTGRYAYGRGGFAVAVRALVSGGKMAADEEGLHVEDADSALFLLAARRFEGDIPDVAEGVLGKIPESAAGDLAEELEKLPSGYELLLKRHMEIHQPLFDRLSVKLGGEEDYLLTTRELKEKQFISEEILPAYMEAMVDMGRFFLLNECGKFPPLHGHLNININHQISAGNIGNLPEMMESFFRWIEWQLPDARENAERILGTRGFLIACHPDEESGRMLHFNRCWPHHYWISGSGWCLEPFLEHYYCTGDEIFLKERVLPLYRELALLYEDFLTMRDEKGKRMFVPSYSPENFPENVPSMLTVNATMDISVCREVFGVLLSLGVKKGMVTEEERARWEKLVSELPDYLMGEHGELKEWAWPEYRERYDHRHASQLYGAYPGDEFQPDLNEELYRAARISNHMRALGNESCHGIMHRAQAAARLKDSVLVEQLLRFTLECGYVTDSFITTHNPYSEKPFPDGQGALPAVLLESLLYSRPGFMEVLPALPLNSFARGEMHGMASRTFARIDSLRWDREKKEIELQFTPLKEQKIRLCFRRASEKTRVTANVPFTGENAGEIQIQTQKDQKIRICWNENG